METEAKQIETAETVKDEKPAESAGEEKKTDKVAEDPLDECRHCPNWLEIKDPARVAALVQNAVEKYEGALLKPDFKPSLAEFFKLMQLDKDMQDQLMEKETRIGWAADETKTEN